MQQQEPSRDFGRGGTKSASLDEVLMILNDHIGEPARGAITVFDDGAAPLDQITMVGILEHWSSDEEAREAAREDAVRMDEGMTGGVGGWGPRMMERWRATYLIGTAELDLWSLPEEWLVTATNEVQVWLAEHTVSLSIEVGVSLEEQER